MWTRSRRLLSATSLFFALSNLTKSTCGNVTWTSPSDGDVYGPGDMILGKWSSAEVVLAPTFRLCFSGSINGSIGARDIEGGCGAYMSPAVEKSAGSYLILLGVPNVTEEDAFYLQMEDDFGKTALSPVFALSPTPSAPYVNPEDNSSATNQSVPPTTAASSVSQTSSVQSSIAMTAKAMPSAVVPPAPRFSQRPQSHAIHGALLKTAIAVPLSLLAFILLLVGIFVFRLNRHRLADESSGDAERRDLSRRSSPNSSSSLRGITDVEKAPDVAPEMVLAPAPTFTTHDLFESVRRDVEHSPHKAFLMSPSLRQSSISSLDTTPNTVPAKTFRSWTHARAANTNRGITSLSVPLHFRATPLSSSPLRQTCARDEDDDEASE